MEMVEVIPSRITNDCGERKYVLSIEDEKDDEKFKFLNLFRVIVYDR